MKINEVLYLDIMETYRTPEDTYPTMFFWYPNMSLTSKRELVLRFVELFYQSFFYPIQLMVKLLLYNGIIRAESVLLDYMVNMSNIMRAFYFLWTYMPNLWVIITFIVYDRIYYPSLY